MSRGLGASQRLFLRAFAALEEDAVDGYQGHFHVWAVVDRAYSLSSRLITRQARAEAAETAYLAKLRADALDGCDLSRELYGIERRLRAPRGRASRIGRKSPALTEGAINPSRVLALLARRGLVDRVVVKGGGSAGLTPAGRELAALL